MALAKTTLASPLGVNDNSMVVASVASLTPGRLAEIDQETVQVIATYNGTSTTVPILRGREGSASAAHKQGANVTHGTAGDFAVPAPQTVVTYPVQRAKIAISVSATSSLVLPGGASDVDVILNGVGPITLTIAPPTPDQDGSRLTIYGNQAAAHVLVFTGGLGGVGAGYTTITNNASGPTALMAVAANGLWVPFTAGGLSGTVTKVVAGIA
jgi:hypothetical protein